MQSSDSNTDLQVYTGIAGIEKTYADMCVSNYEDTMASHFKVLALKDGSKLGAKVSVLRDCDRQNIKHQAKPVACGPQHKNEFCIQNSCMLQWLKDHTLQSI